MRVLDGRRDNRRRAALALKLKRMPALGDAPAVVASAHDAIDFLALGEAVGVGWHQSRAADVRVESERPLAAAAADTARVRGLATATRTLLLSVIYAGEARFREEAMTLARQAAHPAAIARHYLQLVEDQDSGQKIFERVRTAWERTHDCLLEITGQSRLLENNPSLDASIRLRVPYIEPLNLLQVELIKRYRAGETDPRVQEGIQLSINAVATRSMADPMTRESWRATSRSSCTRAACTRCSARTARARPRC